MQKKINKLIEECNENIEEEIKILDKTEDKSNSCILCIVLFSIRFTINIGIGTYFNYYKYINHDNFFF